MELRAYLAILWRRKVIIVIIIGLTGTVANLGTLMMAPTYVASTTLRVITAADGSVESVGWDDIQYADRLMNTFSKMVTSDPLLAELAQRIGLDEPPQVEVEILANTELMQITVEDRNPVVAA